MSDLTVHSEVEFSRERLANSTIMDLLAGYGSGSDAASDADDEQNPSSIGEAPLFICSTVIAVRPRLT